MRTITARSFFNKLLFSNERFGILWTRGGLGNQLFQVSALSFFADSLDFSPIIHPHNLRQARDEFNPQYRNLKIESLFSSGKQKVDPSPVLELVLILIHRVCSNFFSFMVYNESKLVQTSAASIPKLFFIQDYFESKEYPDRLDTMSLNSLMGDFSEGKIGSRSSESFRNEFSAMMHIRLTDSHNKVSDNTRFHNIETSLKQIDFIKRISTLDIYSDDIPLSKELLGGTFDSIQKVYPEESVKLSPTLLLFRFIQYDCIIASNSTLSWWACYLRSRLSTREALIFADFEPELMNHGWKRI